MFGRHERVRRGGYPSRKAAENARDELLERSRAERTTQTQTWTVARWLRYWFTTRTSIRPSTLRSYTEHIEQHLIPHLGRIRFAELTGRDLTAMFASPIGGPPPCSSRCPEPATSPGPHRTWHSSPSGLTRLRRAPSAPGAPIDRPDVS
jgi:hypothetical protein